MRPVLFLFYTVETLVNMFVMNYYLTAFYYIHEANLPVDEELSYMSYLVSFYIFTVLVLFASVNVCTKNQPSILEEVLRPLVGCVLYTVLTLMALYDAETDFFVMHPSPSKEDPLLPEKPVHPYFNLLRNQATASLVCSTIYLLHCLIALDVLLSNEDPDSEEEKSSDISDEITDMVESEYEPVKLYVLGSDVQEWLEGFQWFRDYINLGSQNM